MKNTKRSLITSLVTLLLCSAMFVGSSFAWFTDTVSNTGNKIQAGTLNVELWQKESTLSDAQKTDTTVKAITEDGYTEYSNISDSTVAVFNYDKWEPGYATSLPFAVVNVGNLAFKYNVYFYITEETAGTHETSNANSLLSKVIKVYKGTSREDTKDEANYLGTLADFTKESATGHKISGKLLPKGSEKKLDDEQIYITSSDLVFIMPETAGNEYQGASLTFDIRVEATQYTYEKDGFGSKLYDDNSTLEPDSIQPSYATSKVENDKPTKFVVHGDNIAKDATNNTTIEFPVGALTKEDGKAGESEVEIIATPILTANKSFKVTSDNGAVGAIDLTVTVDGEQVNSFNDQEVIVTTYIAKGLTLNGKTDKVGVEYDGEGDAPVFVSYVSSTGELKFKTKHFSRFLIDADQTAYINETNVAYSVSEAFNNVNNGQTITMIKNYKYPTSPSYLYSQKAKYTIDLNGYTLDLNDSGYGLYLLKGQNVTINDSKGGGELKNRQCVIYMLDGSNLIINDGYIGGADKDQATIYGYGNLTINGGIVDTAKKNGYDYYAVMIGNYSNDNTPAKFVMTDGKVNGSLYLSGNDKDDNIINISGGEVNASSYIAGQNTTTITGGKFSGTTCFYFKAGTVNISGGTFTSTKGDGDWLHKDSACTNTGDAIIFEACGYPAGYPIVNITGGTFKGYKEEGGTEPTSGNIYFKNYGILVIDYASNSAVMSGTTIPYQEAVVANNTDEKFLTGNGYIHFIDDNTTTINPSVE